MLSSCVDNNHTRLRKHE